MFIHEEVIHTTKLFIGHQYHASFFKKNACIMLLQAMSRCTYSVILQFVGILYDQTVPIL